jgi:hypothetical protein
MANPGYVFKNWSGGDVKNSYATETEVYFNIDTQITANFEKAKTNPPSEEPTLNEFTLEIHSSDKNHGITNPSGSNIYGKGEIAILAKPKAGYTFSHWEGPSITNKYDPLSTINLTENSLVAAIFIPISQEEKYVRVDKSVKTFDYLGEEILLDENGGTIIGGSSFAVGFEPTFKAHAQDAFKFVRWENSIGQALSTSPEIKFDSETDFSLVAIFQKKSYFVEIKAQPAGAGFLKWDDKTESFFRALIPHGNIINISALDSSEHKFLNWKSVHTNLKNPQEDEINLKVTSDLDITAYYYPLESVRLNTKVVPEQAGWIIGGGDFPYNSNHLLHAKPNPGYEFVRWEGEQIYQPSSQQTSVNLDQDLNVSAVFKPDLTYSGNELEYTPGLHSLQVKSNNEDIGDVSGSGVYGTGWITINATPKASYQFSHWSGGSLANSTMKKTQVLLESNTIVTAHFEQKPLFSDSTINLNGWCTSSWFGNFWNKHPEKWAYHQNLGWIYAHEIEESSYWVWINRLNNWYWIRKSTFPYIYLGAKRSWHYLLLSDANDLNEIIIYEFDSNRWRKID